jgi:hypothetical protein
MKKILLLTLLFISWTYYSAQGRKINLPSNCSSFQSCYDLSTKTDILRNKIRYLDGAIHFWKTKDTKQVRARAFNERAQYLVREALGETGYKGSEINLKVNHNKAYKETSYESAISDLTEALTDPSLLGDQEKEATKLLNDTKELLNSL